MLFANHLAVSFVVVHSECYSTYVVLYSARPREPPYAHSSRTRATPLSPPWQLLAAGCWLPSCTLNTCSEFTDFRVQNQLRRYRVVCSSSSSSTLPGRVLGPLSLSALSLSRAEREREGEDERGESIACRDPTQPKRTMQCCFCLVANPWRHCQ
jgi:hypothetical protein